MRLVFISIFIVFTFSSAWAQTSDPASPASGETEPAVIDILPVDALMLGSQEENGVLATAYLYKTPGDQNGEFPYVLFVRFIGSENNILVEKGLVACKFEDTDGNRTSARKMDFKNGYFVAGLNATERRSQTLHVGCKLEDEKKRQYRYALNRK